MGDEERVRLVKACKWVDEVAFDTPYQPTVATLDKCNADFCVHGDDLPVGADGGPHAYWEVEQAGRLRVVKRTEGVSTTDLVGRLLLATSEHLQQRVSPKKAPSRRLDDDEAQGVLPSGSSDEDEGHYARAAGSNFMPTSFRISQFSNSKAPGKDDQVVYISGSFDLFHVGHVEILEECKKQGSFLLVGVHDDETVNKAQGRNYPIMNLHERVLNVLSCGFVDDVVIGAQWAVSSDMVTTFNISKVISLDHPSGPVTDSPMADPHKVAREMGLMVQMESPTSLTTEQLVHRIVDNRDKYVNRNKTREAKEMDYLQNAKGFVAEE